MIAFLNRARICVLEASGGGSAGTVGAGSSSLAGSSAAAPVYRSWAGEYAKSVAGAPLNYEPIGSGAGMARIGKREVDFGASDVMASAEDLKKHDLVMFPTAITGVVPVVNLPGVASHALRLNGEVLAKLFLGAIQQWDAPELRQLNPGLKLPSLPVRLVVRADGSGTTWHFADYLSRVSATWKQQRGVANKFAWPADALAVKGSAAVSEKLRATPGAISYIDYNYVLDDKLTAVSMRNAEGQFVIADVETFRSAVSHSAWARTGDFSESLVERPGARTWPITMGTYVALPRKAPQTPRTERALQFIAWAYLNGDALARQAKFVPLPDKVQASAYREIAKITGAQGEPLGMALMAQMVK